MFDQYMCYCNNADGTLGKSISDAGTKIPQVASSIKEGAAMKIQLESELKEAQVNRVDAKDANAKTKAEAEANIGALAKAIPAIEKGMGGAFLQTTSASILRQISVSANMNTADRDVLASFLSAGSNYAPASGEIVGILKTLHDEMTKDFADATADENGSIASFE